MTREITKRAHMLLLLLLLCIGLLCWSLHMWLLPMPSQHSYFHTSHYIGGCPPPPSEC